MLPGVALKLLVCIGLIPLITADTTCSETVPCAIGCCGEYGVCGMGPNYCGSDVCINSCDAKAECNPGGWAADYVNSTNCPLDVCCSEYGFCGTTEEFCGNKTVTPPSCDASTQSITRVIGYYNSAAATRSCDGMAPYSIPQGVYSHLYFAFGSINPTTFEVIPGEQSDETLYPQLVALQLRDPGQELWLSIGGWDFSDSDESTATTFSDLAAADTTKQNNFFKSLINFMSTYGFTGVDIDWEYPVASDRNGRAEDYENYPTFLASLKEALSDYKYGLSITLPTSYWYLQNFDLVAIEPSVDWFNVMSYDLHGTWDITDVWTGPYLDAHTNLTDIKAALNLLWGVNITASKVTLGMAFYGRSYTLENPSCSEPGCQYLSAGTAGTCSQTAGVLFNSEIADIINEQNLTATLYEDAAVKTITWDTDQWVSFDDEDTWKLKVDYAKSVCVGGVMVWSIDEDDDTHTFSNGLAAALGNTVNLDSSSSLSSVISDSVTTTTESTQGDYCRFINCGDTCPNGFSDIVREDNKKQLMLDSTECLIEGTQTLCCPTSSTLPTCRWRGFNGGKCKAGCESDEAEVGTITAGCRTGHQSACCTITNSTEPWSKCAWTSTCMSDDTCPSGYDEFVVGSRQGWGGRRSCASKTQSYNYCCKSSIPDAFTNCAWTGHVVTFPNTAYCTDACPSGSIRIAEEGINTMFGNNQKAKTADCLFGNEAYCCNGTTKTVSTVTPRGSELSLIEYEFQFYLNSWLQNPTCSTVDDEYIASFSKRDVSKRGGDDPLSTFINDVAFAYLVNYIVTYVTSEDPDEKITKIWIEEMSNYGYSEEAANITLVWDTLYGYGGSWSDTPITPPIAVVGGLLCDIADSATGIENFAAANSALCEIGTGSSTLSKRMLAVDSVEDRSSNGDIPTIYAALEGISNNKLTFHYARWLRANPNRDGVPQVILEVAYWIGATPGTTPSSTLLDTYGDSTHTAATDRWIVMHLHIPLDDSTFYNGGKGQEYYYPGVNALSVYHSQTLHTANLSPPRAEWIFSSSYAEGNQNTGTLQNYNSRSQALGCDTGQRWYVGRNDPTAIAGLRTAGRPAEYTEALNSFGLVLFEQGILSTQNLARMWPTLPSLWQGGDGWKMTTNTNGLTAYNPPSSAFYRNFDGAGNSVDITGTAPSTSTI